MGKLLLLLAIVVALVWLLRRPRRGAAPRRGDAQPRGAPQAMIECAHCGLHLPEAEAFTGPGGRYCSEAHRLAGPR